MEKVSLDRVYKTRKGLDVMVQSVDNYALCNLTGEGHLPVSGRVRMLSLGWAPWSWLADGRAPGNMTDFDLIDCGPRPASPLDEAVSLLTEAATLLPAHDGHPGLGARIAEFLAKVNEA